MKRLLLALGATAIIALPVMTLAQGAPPMAPLSPEMRTQIETLRADAKVAVYAPLSTDHRAAVTAIVNQVIAGTLMVRAAVDQIDTLLSPAEKTAVLAAGQKSRDDLRARLQAMRTGTAPPSGPPPGGPPPDGMRPDGTQAPAPDAGRVLLMSSLTREQLRAARPRPSPTP